eukprot:TRINITY_DN13591_c0_g1_i1.p1 TRINITY_DN13591_c0_g1~~TRINITY_DN13591_c0_g1_i1.p1  ORF type:complete len:274 (-),score=40.50 TRINITY_DN13591_c0_g1_i1:298-1119(-)
MEEASIPVPIWEPDSARSVCALCPKGFTLTCRRHHCRGCGILICEQCSLARLRLPPHFGNGCEPQRVCLECVNQRFSLYKRAADGDRAAVECLLSSQSDSESQTCTSALHVAIERGNTEAARMLLTEGYLVDTADAENVTALHLAAMKGHQQSIKLLLEFAADVNSKDRQGRTPLHSAARHGQATVLQSLLTAKAPASAPDENGITPLHLVCAEGNALMAHFLIQAGADPEMRDAHGLRPQELDREGTIQEVLGLMKQDALEKQDSDAIEIDE